MLKDAKARLLLNMGRTATVDPGKVDQTIKIQLDKGVTAMHVGGLQESSRALDTLR